MAWVMLPYAEYNMRHKWLFQQDNDTKHTNKMAKNWFFENRIEALEWPTQSPGPNPTIFLHVKYFEFFDSLALFCLKN